MADLKERRKAAGMTQGELAKAAGCSAGMIGLMETNRAHASAKLQERIEKSLAAAPAKVVEVEAPKPPATRKCEICKEDFQIPPGRGQHHRKICGKPECKAELAARNTRLMRERKGGRISKRAYTKRGDKPPVQEKAAPAKLTCAICQDQFARNLKGPARTICLKVECKNAMAAQRSREAYAKKTGKPMPERVPGEIKVRAVKAVEPARPVEVGTMNTLTRGLIEDLRRELVATKARVERLEVSGYAARPWYGQASESFVTGPVSDRHFAGGKA